MNPTSEHIQDIVKQVKFDDHGLVPAIMQDSDNNQVLMLAYMNADSLTKTLETGKAHFWSRSRKQLWLKGETSGHIQTVHDIFLDCDSDAVLLKIHQAGVACHTGERSCFFRHVLSCNRGATGK